MTVQEVERSHLEAPFCVVSVVHSFDQHKYPLSKILLDVGFGGAVVVFGSAVVIVATVQVRKRAVPRLRVDVRVEFISTTSAQLEATFLWVQLGHPAENCRLLAKLASHAPQRTSCTGKQRSARAFIAGSRRKPR